MFPLDVAVRGIQLERDEVHRAWRRVKGWIFFWRGVPREPEAEESLAALLARREQVRSTQTAPAKPNAELFRPAKPVTLPLGDGGIETGGATIGATAEPAPEPEATEPKGPTTTTSRLLDAKRRAQKRKD